MAVKLARMMAENYKIIKFLDVEIEDNILKFTGSNASGKSTALEAVGDALMGARNIDDDPIREGEDEGKIVLEFNKYKVERKFRRDDDGDTYTTNLKVTDTSGEKVSKPQTVLNNLMTDIGLRPRKFAQADKNEQIDMLLEVVNLNFDKDELEFYINGREPADGDNPIEIMDNTHNEIYQERRDVGRDRRKAKESLKNYEDVEKVEEVNVKELYDEKEKLQNENQEIMDEVERKEDLEEDITEKEKEIEEVKEEIKRLQEKLGKLEEEKTEMVEEVGSIENTLDEKRETYKQNQKRIKKLEEEIDKADTINEQARKFEEKQKLQEEFKKYDNQYRQLSDILDDIEDYKQKLIEEAEFPLEGLTFEDGEIYYDGHPFDQASQTEKLGIGFAILKELKPDLKVILIENGNTIDKEHMSMIRELAEEDDYLILMEYMDPDADTGIMLENGEVKKNNYNDIGDKQDPFVDIA